MRLINDALGTAIAFLVMAIVMYPIELYSNTIVFIITLLTFALVINTIKIKRYANKETQTDRVEQRV